MHLPIGMLITITTEILASIMWLFLLLAASPYGRNALFLIKFLLKKLFPLISWLKFKKKNLKNILFLYLLSKSVCILGHFLSLEKKFSWTWGEFRLFIYSRETVSFFSFGLHLWKVKIVVIISYSDNKHSEVLKISCNWKRNFSWFTK